MNERGKGPDIEMKKTSQHGIKVGTHKLVRHPLGIRHHCLHYMVQDKVSKEEGDSEELEEPVSWDQYSLEEETSISSGSSLLLTSV